MNANQQRMDLAAKIKGMPIPERLRFAAMLIERGKTDIAQEIVEDISHELIALGVK